MLSPKARAAFDREIAKTTLPRIRLHDLRHTWATLALAAGVHAKVVQERLGHSTIALTADVYGHLFPSMDDGAELKEAEKFFVA